MGNLHKFKDSSAIDHCDFDDSSNTMIIKFASGGVYHYPDCKKEAFEALKAAASPGSHFHKNLRHLKSKRVGG